MFLRAALSFKVNRHKVRSCRHKEEYDTPTVARIAQKGCDLAENPLRNTGIAAGIPVPGTRVGA